MRQITVMNGPERRRHWNDEERLRILAEAFAPGTCVADVARKHDISTARIYTWRRKLRQPVEMAEFAQAVIVPSDNPPPSKPKDPAVIVELPGTRRVSIFAAASPALAVAVLKALQ
ncbi:transposase [Novosphingobium sp. SG751A]|uniref:IS66-like element accessory protein TnpA n=1 Tax=Novosphingobium sp. SG751A TaxID=2587000 RepID=UPI001552582D|nr:transposase [Novosphingobium sp. SG751A]NOW48716.1 transposase [Novosphingobium sp. SG751A]